MTKMIDIKLCRDPALVVGWCLRLKTRTHEYFLWRNGWKLKMEVWRND